MLALRGSLGAMDGASRQDIPADERFYSGGGGSVRGIGYQLAGPLDKDDEPLGGRSLAEFSVELRTRFTDSIGGVVFLDGGSVFDNVFPDFDEPLRLGTGAGLRYITPIGPLRFDVGVRSTAAGVSTTPIRSTSASARPSGHPGRPGPGSPQPQLGTAMTKPLKIDFVSDVSCPWCVIGLRGLEEALARAADAVEARITFQPFELNPAMPAEGQNIVEHIAQKYGSSPEQSAANRKAIRDRAASVGFTMATTEQSRIYNTFDAHRLLHWAALQGRQKELKHGLFAAYFTDGQAPRTTRCWWPWRRRPASIPIWRARSWRRAAMPTRSATPSACGGRGASMPCRPWSSTSAI